MQLALRASMKNFRLLTFQLHALNPRAHCRSTAAAEDKYGQRPAAEVSLKILLGYRQQSGIGSGWRRIKVEIFRCRVVNFVTTLNASAALLYPKMLRPPFACVFFGYEWETYLNGLDIALRCCLFSCRRFVFSDRCRCSPCRLFAWPMAGVRWLRKPNAELSAVGAVSSCKPIALRLSIFGALPSSILRLPLQRYPNASQHLQ